MCLPPSVQASIYPGKVLSLKLQKPKGFKYLSGMYIFIQCPQISPFEWLVCVLLSSNHVFIRFKIIDKQCNILITMLFCHFRHPFSLTSGPEDDYLSVHIRTAGDWSYQIYSLFQEVKWNIVRTKRIKRLNSKSQFSFPNETWQAALSGLHNYPKVHIDGPYGAASQDHIKYDIVVLIGLGIGATPFIGILKDIVNGAQNSSHCDHHVWFLVFLFHLRN